MGFLLLGQMDRRNNADVDVDVDVAVAVAVYVIELFDLFFFFFRCAPGCHVLVLLRVRSSTTSTRPCTR